MELRPGYKQTEVGVIPEDWEVKALKELATIQRGASPRPIDSPVWYDRESTVGWVRISDVTRSNGKHLRETEDYLSNKGIANSRFLPAGSLIMSICATVGLPVITKIDSCIHDGFVGFTRLKLVDQEYLYYKLKEQESAFRSMGQTGSQSNLNTGLVQDCPVALPSLPEQRAIAAALSDVDALLASLDALIAKKRDLKQAAMQQLLSGRQRLPGFSGEWEVKRLGDMFQFLGTANNARSDLSEFGDVGYIHYGDVHAATSSFLNCAITKMPHIARNKVKNIPLVENGDLVMVDASEDYEGTGKSIEIMNVGNRKIVAGLHTLLMRGNKEHIADGFKGYLQCIPLVRTELIRLATGISVYGISKNNVMSIEVPLPCPDEQTAIAAVLSDMDAEIAALEARRDKTRALKQGMMQELLTGRIRLV